MKPIYIPNFYKMSQEAFFSWVDSLTWEEQTQARKELFMSDPSGISYSYGSERAQRTYTSQKLDKKSKEILFILNNYIKEKYSWGPLNGVFLNRYDGKKNALGWHADDFEGMDHTCPIGVISFGEEREIWWRQKGHKGVIPLSQRQLLEWGSLFIMPPRFQDFFDHKIPKGDREMGMRVSLTARAFEV